MASIHIESAVAVTVDTAWQALKRIDGAHRLFGPVLISAEVHGDIRTARFGNGLVVHERIIDVDDVRRRVSYSVLDSPTLTYHHASMQVVEDGSGRCRFMWTTDFLPGDAAGGLRALIEAGSKALKVNLEK